MIPAWYQIDFNLSLIPPTVPMSHAASMGIPLGLMRKAINNALIPCSVSPKSSIVASPSVNKKNAKIESSIELNIQTNWHTSKMTDIIRVTGNSNILSNIRIKTDLHFYETSVPKLFLPVHDMDFKL